MLHSSSPSLRQSPRLRAWRATARAWLIRPGLSRDIAGVLLVKLVLIEILRVACFSHPAAPDMRLPDSAVAAAIVGPLVPRVVPQTAGLPSRATPSAPQGQAAHQDVDHVEP